MRDTRLMARDDIQLNVRVPSELKQRLDESAEKNGRSITAEVVARLTRSFEDVEQLILNNRFRELSLIDQELEEVNWVIEKLSHVVSRDDVKYQESLAYRDRLSVYRSMVQESIAAVESGARIE